MRWKRGIELLVGVALGLGFFLLILWFLNLVFPGSSGIGLFARGENGSASDRSLIFDGADGGEPIARLTEVRRNVKDRSARSVVWNRSHRGADLKDRHAVQSRKGSGATIAFDDTNRLELDEETLIVVRRPNRFSSTRETEGAVLFVDGRIRGRLGGEGDTGMDIEIVTAGGSIRAQPGSKKPADISVLATTDGATTVSVHDGAADILWGDRTTSVPANHAVIFGANGTPGRPMRLPGRPSLSAPERDKEFLYRSSPPRIDFRWSTVKRAETYRFEIARDASFRDVVYETFVEQPEFVHGNLRAGRYWWRASALNGGAEGRSSRSGRFEVVQDNEPPILALELPDGPLAEGRLTLQGSSEPGCRIVIGDTDVTADAGGDFTVEFDVNAGYNLLVVQAVDQAGNTTFVSKEFQARVTQPGSSL